jgi:hypothetical protein
MDFWLLFEVLDIGIFLIFFIYGTAPGAQAAYMAYSVV